MEILYKGIFSLPDYLSIFNDDSNRLVTYGYESLLYGISIKIIFQNKEILDISAEMMIADTQFEKEEYPITIHKESSEIPEIKKVAFTFGMYNDYMLILTDAPKSAIEDWAREYTKGLEDNNNVYFKPLQKNYYVKIIADSEIHDLSWEDVETIGFNEVYDLGDYMENNKE